MSQRFDQVWNADGDQENAINSFAAAGVMTPDKQRLFPFIGTDPEYIALLECECQSLRRQCAELMQLLMPLDGEARQGPSPPPSLEIVPYIPGSHQLPERDKPYWKKALSAFVAALPSEENWNEARTKAGIDTPFANQLALRLMLGHINAVTSPWNTRTDSLPRIPPTENQDLVMRGYHYAQFLGQCSNDLSFTASVVAFQKLIFVSYCVVMVGRGISKETTNTMMRRYFSVNSNDDTLAGYRWGVMWVNRCMAALLANGWGHKSWEIFLLGKFLLVISWLELTRCIKSADL